jgi:hypothetical protein
MITRFKIYENMNPNYRHLHFFPDLAWTFGEYIYVDQNKNNYEFKSVNSNELEPYSVIKQINANPWLHIKFWDYLIESYNFVKNCFEYNYILKEAIIRKLTPQEIEEFETKKEALKYNL